jgi:rubrerythrin
VQVQVLLDKLSEFLMTEQGGFELYRVAASRSIVPELRSRYEEFGQETARHREILVQLITELGGDPDYVSPTARLVQYKASKLLGAALQVDGLSMAEAEVSDLENVLLAETKDHANWHLLRQLTPRLSGEQQQAVQAAVDAVEDQEDQHLNWARETLSMLCLQMLEEQSAPNPLRWQTAITGPEPPIDAFHPAPFTDGLLDGARLPIWIETPISRSLAAAGAGAGAESSTT